MSLQLLLPTWVIPVAPRTVLLDHAVVIDGKRIVAVLPAAEAIARYGDARRIELPQHALIPGLVNLHTHSAMALLRGYADDLALMTWLNEHIWPAEGRHVSDEFVFDGTLLAIAEMIAGGTTCANDGYFHHDAVARAALAGDFRIMVGASILEFPTAYARNADQYISKAIQCIDQYKGEEMVGFTLAPHAPYTVSDATFRQIVTLADQLDLGLHCHIHETQQEISDSLKEHGVRPLARLAGLGVLSNRLVAAHMVHTTDDEHALLARYGVHIAHCPASNLKLASGIARITDMHAAGVSIGVATDGAASNNKLDLFAEMRLAALLAKGASGNPEAISAYDALTMATLNGARALGWDDRIGSITAGKDADLVAVDLSAIATQPCYDPVSHLVYACDRTQVSDVWIAGQRVLQNGVHTRLDLAALSDTAHRWRERITQHA
ncbi:TRZ/ATZ family hydrolase [Chitinibacteraceae bacterium HSL-7]